MPIHADNVYEIMRAFLIDQVQQLCSPTYQKARQHAGPFKVLFERIRNVIQLGVLTNGQTLSIYIANPEQRAAFYTRLGVSIEVAALQGRDFCAC